MAENGRLKGNQQEQEVDEAFSNEYLQITKKGNSSSSFADVFFISRRLANSVQIAKQIANHMPMAIDAGLKPGDKRKVTLSGYKNTKVEITKCPHSGKILVHPRI